MKAKITAFINELILYDYILFSSIFVLFLLFVILGILLRHKTTLAIFLVLISFSILIAGPTIGYAKMHEYIFKNTIELISQKKLNFTQAVVVKGNITNTSKRFFKNCKIIAGANKASKNELKNYIYSFKTLAKMSIIEEDIAIGEKREFKIIIEPFRYSKDFNITIGASCK